MQLNTLIASLSAVFVLACSSNDFEGRAKSGGKAAALKDDRGSEGGVDAAAEGDEVAIGGDTGLESDGTDGTDGSDGDSDSSGIAVDYDSAGEPDADTLVQCFGSETAEGAVGIAKKLLINVDTAKHASYSAEYPGTEPVVLVFRVEAEKHFDLSIDVSNPKALVCLDLRASKHVQASISVHCDAEFGQFDAETGKHADISISRPCN